MSLDFFLTVPDEPHFSHGVFLLMVVEQQCCCHPVITLVQFSQPFYLLSFQTITRSWICPVCCH